MKKAQTLEELAAACGINPDGLRATVDRVAKLSFLTEDGGAAPAARQSGTPPKIIFGSPHSAPAVSAAAR